MAILEGVSYLILTLTATLAALTTYVALVTSISLHELLDNTIVDSEVALTTDVNGNILENSYQAFLQRLAQSIASSARGFAIASEGTTFVEVRSLTLTYNRISGELEGPLTHSLVAKDGTASRNDKSPDELGKILRMVGEAQTSPFSKSPIASDNVDGSERLHVTRIPVVGVRVTIDLSDSTLAHLMPVQIWSPVFTSTKVFLPRESVRKRA